MVHTQHMADLRELGQPAALCRVGGEADVDTVDGCEVKINTQEPYFTRLSLKKIVGLALLQSGF